MSTLLTPQEAQRLHEENLHLRSEIARLNGKLSDEKLKYRADFGLDNPKVREALTAVQVIESKEKDSEVIKVYRELVRERRKSAVLAELLEEARTHFFEIKRLYERMEELQQEREREKENSKKENNENKEAVVENNNNNNNSDDQEKEIKDKDNDNNSVSGNSHEEEEEKQEEEQEGNE